MWFLLGTFAPASTSFWRKVYRKRSCLPIQLTGFLYFFLETNSGIGTHPSMFFWLVVWNMFMTFHILGIILPFGLHIFQRGRYTTNQSFISKYPLILVISPILLLAKQTQKSCELADYIARIHGTYGKTMKS